MGQAVQYQESKEFQLKLEPVPADGRAARDAGLYGRARLALMDAAHALASGEPVWTAFPAGPWYREGIRHDTDPDKRLGLMRRHGLSLAIEATDERTKLKCKLHGFMPETLLAKPRGCIAHPKPGKAARYKHCDATLKLEQDLHFNNTKHCASGSLFLKGRRAAVETLAYYSEYFPALAALAEGDTRLHPVAHWQETIHDGIGIGWGSARFECMLVNRWTPDGGELIESELSYKIKKPLDADWDHPALARAARLYTTLQAAGAFQPHPPIFYFQDPVASVEIAELCGK